MIATSNQVCGTCSRSKGMPSLFVLKPEVASATGLFDAL